MMNNNGLSTEPLCTRTLTKTIYSLYRPTIYFNCRSLHLHTLIWWQALATHLLPTSAKPTTPTVSEPCQKLSPSPQKPKKWRVFKNDGYHPYTSTSIRTRYKSSSPCEKQNYV